MRTDIGHFSIGYEDKQYEIRPTFKNIRKICEPNELPDLFSRLFGSETQLFVEKSTEYTADLFSNGSKNIEMIDSINRKLILKTVGRIYDIAVLVIQCCCDEDTSKLTGFYSYEKGRKAWRVGVMDADNVIHIARSLMIHGVVGMKTSKSDSKGESSSSIDVYVYVENAVNHLNMDISSAENLTKTEYDRYIDNKYPDAKRKGKAPTLEEHDKAMSWLDEINAKRANEKRAN